MNSPQQKEGGNHAEARVDDRAGLYVGIVALAGIALSIGFNSGNEKALDLKLSQQDTKLQQQDTKIRDLETEIMLLRQDVSDLRIEAQSKLQPRTRPK